MNKLIRDWSLLCQLFLQCFIHHIHRITKNTCQFRPVMCHNDLFPKFCAATAPTPPSDPAYPGRSSAIIFNGTCHHRLILHIGLAPACLIYRIGLKHIHVFRLFRNRYLTSIACFAVSFSDSIKLWISLIARFLSPSCSNFSIASASLDSVSNVLNIIHRQCKPSPHGFTAERALPSH